VPTARALQAYQAQSGTEVSFAAGEVVKLLKQDPSGWSEVETMGGPGGPPQKGWAPSTWLEVIQLQMPSSGPPPPRN
jgi:hypothetical protein